MINLETYKEKSEAINASYRAEFSALTAEQLNWKESEKSWSVAECIDHIITTNTTYFPQLESLVSGNYSRPFGSRIPFFSKLFGGMIKKFVEPTIQKKSATIPAFRPQSSTFSYDELIQNFTETQNKLASYIARLDGFDLKKHYMVSPAGGAITYSLEDLLIIILSHDERHLNQARAVMEKAKNAV